VQRDSPGGVIAEGRRCDVVSAGTDEGAAALEILPISPDAARAFLRCSPRNLRLDEESARRFGACLADSGFSRIFVQDNKSGFMKRTLSGNGWDVAKAIDSRVKHRYNIVATSDLPLEEDLIDHRGEPLDLTNTGHMVGLQLELEGRKVWAFYSDDGDAARVLPSGDARTGMLAGFSEEDTLLAADQLVRFFATAKKSWAVFSVELEDMIRQFQPTPTHRMELEAPSKQDHSVEPLSRDNKKEAIALFSEYYDEGSLTALLRLRRMARDKAYSVFVADGGFVIVRFDKDMGLIYDIYVTPSKQGGGVGGELMRCALDSLSGRVEKVYLHTSYPRAKKLYEKFGFGVASSHLVIRLDEVVLTPPPSR
jgi:GNAT superfamily N-acetyltransferase